MGLGVSSMIPMGLFTLARSIYHLPVLSYTDKRLTYPTFPVCNSALPSLFMTGLLHYCASKVSFVIDHKGLQRVG
jgi:hypothetical protein